MQRKHLIALTLVTIFLLLGFNIINTNRHEQSRSSDIAVDIASDSAAISNSTDMTAQPLDQQPKAIIDEATAKINQAQQTDQARLSQANSETQ